MEEKKDTKSFHLDALLEQHVVRSTPKDLCNVFKFYACQEINVVDLLFGIFWRNSYSYLDDNHKKKSFHQMLLTHDKEALSSTEVTSTL